MGRGRRAEPGRHCCSVCLRADLLPICDWANLSFGGFVQQPITGSQAWPMSLRSDGTASLERSPGILASLFSNLNTSFLKLSEPQFPPL